MKTTIEIPDDLFRKAKATAALDGIKLKDLLADGLRLRLAAKKEASSDAGKRRPLIDDSTVLPIVKGKRKLKVTPKRIHELEMKAELERHAASLR